MAKSGKKEILFPVSDPDVLDDMSVFINKKSKGLRVSFNYAYDVGLRIGITGPKDRVNIFEHQLLEYYDSLV